jgi:N-acetylmuramoyl-L-alanine amidase
MSDRLIFYFEKDPLCITHPVRQESGQAKRLTLFLPLTSAQTSTLKKQIENINNEKKESYTLKISETNAPVAGLKIDVEYDETQILSDYSSCYSISASNGLIINFHHRARLDSLAKKTDKLMHTVSSTITKPKIMLDFGHGGFDTGKIGYDNVQEKDINFQVGKKVSQLLQAKGYHVLLTRTADQFVPLDQRTRLANKEHAHIFVSIHANASIKPEASGIETFWSCRSARCPLVQKNQLVKVAMHSLDSSSKLLAEKIQSQVIKTVNNHHQIVDRNVKESLTQVLIGTDMASALIEIGFLTNKEETLKLKDPNYQLLIAQGISCGIEDYWQQHIASLA